MVDFEDESEFTCIGRGGESRREKRDGRVCYVCKEFDGWIQMLYIFFDYLFRISLCIYINPLRSLRPRTYFKYLEKSQFD